ncbi:MAG TPA: hypothetical protein VKX25_07465 [Bryobacteraceae bacterium]|jgi:hypothetical protein|nr:hypothetical protein [Bryobacteraceae bacterium]
MLPIRFSALLVVAAMSLIAAPPQLQLWYWHHSDLNSDKAVAQSKALIDRAAKAGYNGLAFWDGGWIFLGAPFWPAENAARLREVSEYAVSKGMRVMGSGAPFGWSNPALTASNGNFSEGQRITGARFRVAPNGRELEFVNGLAPLENPGFENGREAWFGTGDPAIGLSSASHSGKQAAVIVDATGNARFRQRISLTPWRQYHIRLWMKSKEFRGGPAVVEIQDFWHRKRFRFYTALAAAGTHDWKRLDFTFDSQDTGWAYLYFGVWGPTKGVLWFDDVQLEETAPVYVVRRSGAPLTLYDPDHSRTVYQEGRDFNYVCDPVLSNPKTVFRDDYHTPVHITLPGGTHLRSGQTVALDYYAAFPIPGDGQMAMCLTEPGVFRWIESNARATKDVLPPQGDMLLVYDELRHANSCAGCRARQLTAGELLAWNVNKVAAIYQRLLPETPLWVWSDMFDPLHNAHDNYYYVEGDLAGSWKGLPARVGVLNWNHPHLRQSLEWFAGMHSEQPVAHRQIIAGYYDSGRGATAREDFETARGIPGIAGIMYVSWKDDYSQLESFAEAARAGWREYQSSVRAGR